MRLANLALAGILVALAGCGGAPVTPEPPLRSQASTNGPCTSTQLSSQPVAGSGR